MTERIEKKRRSAGSLMIFVGTAITIGSTVDMNQYDSSQHSKSTDNTGSR